MATNVGLPPGFELEESGSSVPVGFELEPSPAPPMSLSRMASMTTPVGLFTPRTPQEVRDVPAIAANVADIAALGSGRIMSRSPLSGPVGLGALLTGRAPQPSVRFPMLRTPFGKRTAAIAGTAIGTVLGGGGTIAVGKEAKGALIGPGARKTVLGLRQRIPAWVRSNTEAYGRSLDELISRGGGQIPTTDVASIFQRQVENPELFARLKPPVQKVLTNLFEEFATRPAASVDAKELLGVRQQLRTLLPRGRRFDISETVVNNVTRDVGSTLEPHVPGLSELNARYRKFFDLREVANRTFQPFKGEFETARGESVLKRIFRQPEGTKAALGELQRELKTPFVRQAKTRQFIPEFIRRVPVVRRLL